MASKKIAKLSAALAAGMILAVGAALAAEPDIVLTVEVKEEVSVADEAGKIEVVNKEVEMADPGDVLVYTLTYKNVGKTPAKDAVIHDAVPEGTILLPGSVRGDQANISFSVDGGRSYVPFPAKLQIASMHGAPVQKPAPPEAYTHIRWTAKTPLAPGESRKAYFKVIVR